MSGTYPTSPEFRSINFGSEQRTKVSTTDSGKMFTTQIDGQRFKFSASYSALSRSDFAPVFAFVMKQRSQEIKTKGDAGARRTVFPFLMGCRFSFSNIAIFLCF